MYAKKSDSKSPKDDDSLKRRRSDGVKNQQGHADSNTDARSLYQSPPQAGSGDRKRASLWTENVQQTIPKEYGYYHTVSGANAKYLKDALSRSFHLQTVDEDEKQNDATKSKKHGLFAKKDPGLQRSTSPHPPFRHSSGGPTTKHVGKVKNFLGNIRRRTKSTSVEPLPDPMELSDDHSQSQRRFTVSSTKWLPQFHSPHQQQAREPEIGPSEYIEMYRRRTFSDSYRMTGARQAARDKLTGSHNSSSLSGSTFDGGDDDADLLHYLVWRDHKGSTTIYKMPTAPYDVDDPDVFSTTDTSYARFSHEHTCYDLVPTSSKIVVFDTRLTVKRAFYGLVTNNVKAGILWDTRVQNFTGMLTVTDFIKILNKYYNASEEKSFENIETDSISEWKNMLDPADLIYCSPEDKLFHALQLLCSNKVHRLLVVDKRLGNPINVLTHKRILNFLHLHMNNLPEPLFMEMPISDLGIGTFSDLATITFETTLIEALKLFLDRRISAIPVVDGDNKLVDVFAKFDFSKLAYDKLYSNLERPVKEILPTKHKDSVQMFTCRVGDALKEVVRKIVSASVHRLFVVDTENHVIGVLSLSDILRCLILDPFEKEGRQLEMNRTTEMMSSMSASGDPSPSEIELN